jgi:hypothetical protein
MAFTSTVTGRSKMATKNVTWGTWTESASGTGGNIDTGLTKCDFIALQQTASSVVADAPVVNETLPVDGDAVTIVTTAGADGYWWAMGR